MVVITFTMTMFFFFSLLSFHDISFYWNEANTKSIRQSAAEKNEFRSSNYSLEKIETFFSPYRPVCNSYVYWNPKLQNVLMLYLNLSTVRTLSVKTMSLVVPLRQNDLSFLCLMMHEMAICVLLDFRYSFTSSFSFESYYALLSGFHSVIRFLNSCCQLTRSSYFIWVLTVHPFFVFCMWTV